MANPAVTYEEWLRMPEVTDVTEEVVDGEIRITPPAKVKHAWIVARLNHALDGQLDADRAVIFTGSFGLIVRKAPLTSRVPDLAVFEISTIVEKDGYVHSPPQLVAEVLSPGDALERKLADYASLGVPEVWVVSPEARTVEVLHLENGYLGSTQVLASGTLTPRAFPQVSVDIAAIWPD
jgi:Uma2 family endonuclease